MNQNIAVIMAGGTQDPFWPLTNENNPKQFVNLLGDGSLLQITYNRLLKFFEKEHIYIVTQASFFVKVIQQIPNIDVSNLILEPYARHTTAAISFAFTQLKQKYSLDDFLYFFPSDHIINDLEKFHTSLDIAQTAATELASIITLGIQPTSAMPHYGYIQFDNGRFPNYALYEQGVRWVRTFAEKPDIQTAQRFIQAGDFVWNSGIIIFQISNYEDILLHCLPDYYTAFKRIENAFNKPNFADELDFSYKSINPLSFDVGILEKSKKVFTVISDFDWFDLDNWDDYYRLSQKDNANNVTNKNNIQINTSNSLIYNADTTDNKTIATIDLLDTVIINTTDGLLVCPRSSLHKIKNVVNLQKFNNSKQKF